MPGDAVTYPILPIPLPFSDQAIPHHHSQEKEKKKNKTRSEQNQELHTTTTPAPGCHTCTPAFACPLSLSLLVYFTLLSSLLSLL